jgi:hypothetical protein
MRKFPWGAGYVMELKVGLLADKKETNARISRR